MGEVALGSTGTIQVVWGLQNCQWSWHFLAGLFGKTVFPVDVATVLRVCSGLEVREKLLKILIEGDY